MKFWLKYPRFYDYIQILATGGFLQVVVRALPKLDGKRVLDLGCGTGNLLNHIKPKEYLGVDINKKFIQLAKKKFPDNDFKVLNLVKENLPNNNYDYVFIMNVLHHLSDKQVLGIFRKIKKWKKAKKLIIVESRPVGMVGNFLEGMDAGENFRDFADLLPLVRTFYSISRKKIVKAPFGTYQYQILYCNI